MQAGVIRKTFLDFFADKGHKIVPSSPMVVKNDPSLMFTNAGMNQFKDAFLGNSQPPANRIADTQKCLRVSGKHNDLEEVGYDNYHHTMFEMLGNWSFGDYFKKEAIDWAWELLTDIYKIDKNCLYVTVFEGNNEDELGADEEAYGYWTKHIPKDRILYGNKKDNFWEMGETGPCGPCSEIHIDIRNNSDREKEPGHKLVNQDHPEVIEIWNLVFMQFNRKADQSLEPLPKKHVDTGMGFERLCMVIQGKNSAYETDVFQPIIDAISKLTGKKYGEQKKTDIAFRVIADHLRAISFAIADGEVPSNNGAGYVIRRILRRAVRYGYTFLGQGQPFLYQLTDTLRNVMSEAFPELKQQNELIKNVIREEEVSFLKTLDTGIHLLEDIISQYKSKNQQTIPGDIAFKLYDTYGFPLDLTQLILREQSMEVDIEGFNEEMSKQKSRSRNAATVDTGDWIPLMNHDEQVFVGYDHLAQQVRITRYRFIKQKNKELVQLVFDQTPFYGESGGQVGDTGYIKNEEEKIPIINTIRENNLIIHLATALPKTPKAEFMAYVDPPKRELAANNHTATHLLHHSLRQILGKHVEQKGSLVHPDYLRFDFSHFQKLNQDEIDKIEDMVNKMIRENQELEEYREIPMNKAKEMGATGLFGEKYGNAVRVIRYGDSIELCGGTHVPATGQIGYFKITSETAIAAGIRRIEAVTAQRAHEYVSDKLKELDQISQMVKQKNIVKGINQLIQQNNTLQKNIEQLQKEKAAGLKNELKQNIKEINGIKVIHQSIEAKSADTLKDIAFQLKGEMDHLFLVLGATIKDKANLTIMISEDLVKKYGLDAGKIVKDSAQYIKGGGGGQPFFATAGGKEPAGLDKAINHAVSYIESLS